MINFYSDMESDGNGVFTPPPTNNTSKEQPPPLPTSPLPDDDEADANDGRNKTAPAPQGGRIILPPTERLIGGSSSTVVTTRYEPKTDHEDLIPPLPSALEHNIRVLKDSETLGVQVYPNFHLVAILQYRLFRLYETSNIGKFFELNHIFRLISKKTASTD